MTTQSRSEKERRNVASTSAECRLQVGGASISWTMGETFTATLVAGPQILTQGQQQPELLSPIGNRNAKDPGKQNKEAANTGAGFDLAVFPNPTAGDATLAFDLPAGQPFTIRVLDMEGRILSDYKGAGLEGENRYRLHSANFSPGIYTVHFQSGSLSSRKKLVVQH